MIEVGPGTGNLTRHLLAQKARVLAVEKDDTLIERLRDEFKQVGAGMQYLRGQLHSHQSAKTNAVAVCFVLAKAQNMHPRIAYSPVALLLASLAMHVA